MAHTCEYCGMECYCDQDDTGGLPQPNGCPHLDDPDVCEALAELEEE
jgi:hypothetical protein